MLDRRPAHLWVAANGRASLSQRSGGLAEVLEPRQRLVGEPAGALGDEPEPGAGDERGRAGTAGARVVELDPRVQALLHVVPAELVPVDDAGQDDQPLALRLAQ